MIDGRNARILSHIRKEKELQPVGCNSFSFFAG